MSVPVTCRLDETTVLALDRAVADGLADSRSALISAAVGDWLDRHDEEAIAESYRRAYAEPDPEHEAVMRAFATASVEAILAKERADDASR